MQAGLLNRVAPCVLALAAVLMPAMAFAEPAASQPSEREQRLAGRRDARANEEAAEAFRTAETTYLVGDLERAAELFGRVISISSTSPYVIRAQARLGDCSYQSQRFDRAAAAYRRAAELADSATSDDERAAAVRADYMVGQSNFAARQYIQAFGNLRRFIDRHPGHPLVNQAYQCIGDAHLAMEQYQQALSAYRMVGTVLAQKQSGPRRITPGQRLYLRVTDADVNIGDVLKSVKVIVRTSGGDEETLELQPLGLRNPIFIGSLPTCLGEPRHSGDIAAIFNDASVVKIRSQLAQADKMLAESQSRAQDARDLESSGGGGADPAGIEKKRAAAAADAERLSTESARLTAESCKAVDDAFAGIEKLVEKWSPEQSLSNTRKRVAMASTQATTAPATAPADADAAIKAGLPASALDDSDAPAARKPAGMDNDDDLAAPTDGAVALADQPARRGLTQQDIDKVRVQAHDKPTTLANLDARLIALSVWAKSLQRQFQRIELNGADKITVEYYDEVGPNGPNDAGHAIRRDVIEVASDARLWLLAANGRETLEQVVLGGQIVLRVEDADRDISGGKDKVAVVLAAIGGTSPGDAELHRDLHPATKPTSQRATPGEVLPATTQAVAAVPLIPADAPFIKVTLVETETHSGVFEAAIAVSEDGITADGVSLPLKPGNVLRLSYLDDRCIRTEDKNVLVRTAECVPNRGGSVAAVRYRQSPLDLEAKLQRAVAAGELGKLYLDLGLKRRGRDYLSRAQTECTEVSAAAGRSALGEEALYRSWRIYFYAGLLDEAINAAGQLMSRYPNSEYAPAAMLQIGQACLERGEKAAEQAKANNEKPGKDRDLDRAVVQLEKLLQHYPKSAAAPEALFLIGRAKLLSGQSGIDAFERLARNYPDSGFAARGLIRAANYYVGVGDFRRAEEYFSRILIDYPDSPQMGEVLLHRGICQYKLGHAADALKTFYQVIEEHSGTELAHTAQQYINFINQKRGE